MVAAAIAWLYSFQLEYSKYFKKPEAESSKVDSTVSALVKEALEDSLGEIRESSFRSIDKSDSFTNDSISIEMTTAPADTEGMIYSRSVQGYYRNALAQARSARHGAHVDLHKRCGVRTYNLKSGPLLVKKRNTFMQFYQAT